MKYPGDSHYNNNKQEMIIDEQDLKILAGVICQDGFIRIHGVAKIRTSFVPRSSTPTSTKNRTLLVCIIVFRMRDGESWRLPLQQQDQEIIINDHDLKIMVGVIRQEGFILSDIVVLPRSGLCVKIRTFAGLILQESLINRKTDPEHKHQKRLPHHKSYKPKFTSCPSRSV